MVVLPAVCESCCYEPGCRWGSGPDHHNPDRCPLAQLDAELDEAVR